MPTLEERVGHLEQEVAALQGQLGADLRHIDRRFDELGEAIANINTTIGKIKESIGGLVAGNAVVNQKSTTNEKIIFAIAGVLVSAVTFIAGKLL